MWHQWPMLKLASVCSPLTAMAIIFAVLLGLFLLPLARRKKNGAKIKPCVQHN